MSEPAEPKPPADLAPQPQARLSWPALLSFLLGVLIVTGPAALLLGYHSLYRINASEGRLRGRRLAVAALVLGTLGTIVAVGYPIVLLFGRMWQTDARADCSNNLRQLGLAIWIYHDNHHKTFPQAVVATGPLPPEKRLSWEAGILPFLNRKATPEARWETLVQSLDPDQGWEAPVHKLARSTNVRAFLCRGHPGDPRQTPGLTDYVGLAGVGARAASLAATDPNAGFFGYNRPLSDGRLGLDLREGPAGKGDKVGSSSYILIVTETTFENGPWVAGGRPTVRDVDLGQEPLFGPDAPFGGCHAGAFNSLWLDGSVRFQANSLPAKLFAEMVRINKTGEAQPPDRGPR